MYNVDGLWVTLGLTYAMDVGRPLFTLPRQNL